MVPHGPFCTLKTLLPGGLDGQEFAALMIPVGEGRGLMSWAMVSGMLMVSGEM